MLNLLLFLFSCVFFIQGPFLFFCPEKHKETLQDYQVKEGNIVIALTRTIISAGLKVAVVPESYNGALLNKRVAALVTNEKLVNQKEALNLLSR